MRVQPAELLGLARALLEAVRTPPHIAARVAEILVNADLAGHPSHGVMRLPEYLAEVDRGAIAVAAEPIVERQTATTAVMDGARGWGHWAVDRAMACAVAKARAAGVGAVALRRCTHAGRLGEYVEAATRAGCIGLVMAGVGGYETGWAAPIGGRSRHLGPNPIAIGVPTAEGPPFVFDAATTVVARGRVMRALALGEPVPEGWILDAAGRPSVRPEDLVAGGTLALAAGHKGYGLSLAACLLGGLGGGFDGERLRMGGVFVQAVDVGAFLPSTEYGARVARFLEGVRRGPAAAGAEILTPGEPEWRARQRHAAGLEVPEPVWARLVEAAAARGIPLGDVASGVNGHDAPTSAAGTRPCP